jgi:hypothetical protein
VYSQRLVWIRQITKDKTLEEEKNEFVIDKGFRFDVHIDEMTSEMASVTLMVKSPRMSISTIQMK